MRYFKFTPCILLLFTQVSNSQETVDWSVYFSLLSKADSLFNERLYTESTQAYSYAFHFNNQRYSDGDRYNAARAWSMSGQIDSALYHLKKEVNERGYFDVKRIKNEPAFQPLQASKEWKLILETVKLNLKKENEKLGKLKPVKEKLESVLQSDQKYRRSIDSVFSKFGFDSKEVQSAHRDMKKMDEKNLKYVCSIIDKYGWPDYNIVGFDASAGAFLVIQHADSLTQEKYLPIMRQAVKEKKAIGGELAFLEDRVLIRRGEKQIYGTQVHADSLGNWRVEPIEDETNVDQRREQVGLTPLAEYLRRFKIVYKKPD
jgi:hypothetical protein